DAPPPAPDRGSRPGIRQQHQDESAVADQARRRGVAGSADRRHDRLHRHRPRAPRGQREGGRVRPRGLRDRRPGDGGWTVAGPVGANGRAAPGHARCPAQPGSGPAARAAGREPGGGSAGRRDDSRSRSAVDGRSGPVPVEEPELALRWVGDHGTAVEDDRGGSNRMAVKEAVLVLRDGRVFRGQPLGAIGETTGEVIFNTAMSGYQEVLTDPSYRGQIVTMTYPLIGNYGLNDEDIESRRPWVNGFIVKEASVCPSSWRGRVSLDEYLTRHGIVGLQGIDTRALTRHLRDHG